MSASIRRAAAPKPAAPRAPPALSPHQPRSSITALLSARMSLMMILRACGVEAAAPRSSAGVAAADKADRGHAGGNRRGDADRRIFHHDAFARRGLHLAGCLQEQVGRRFAVRHFAGREQERVEEADQVGGLEAEPDAVVRRRRGDAFRPAQPGQRMGDVRRGAQLLAEALQRRAGDRLREVRAAACVRPRLRLRRTCRRRAGR